MGHQPFHLNPFRLTRIALSRRIRVRALNDRAPSSGERARGMPGEGLTHGPPAERKAGGSHHRFSRSTGIPRAMGLRFIRALPGDRLCCPRHPQIVVRELDLSTGRSGPHDFTVRTSVFVGTRKDAARPHGHRSPPRVS